MARSATDIGVSSSHLEDASTVSATTFRGLGWVLTVGGFVGLIAAVILLVEKIELIRDPDYIPSCSINPVLSCGSIMDTAQAEAFGFPNPIIGVAGFAAVTVIGLGILAGATFHRWFWLGVLAGVTFAAGFVHWLIFQSLYEIGALCPYCMVVWAVTVPIFWYTTTHLLATWRRGARSSSARVIDVVIEYRGAILTAWFLIIGALIALRFWDYWRTLL